MIKNVEDFKFNNKYRTIMIEDVQSLIHRKIDIHIKTHHRVIRIFELMELCGCVVCISHRKTLRFKYYGKG
jgi:hypothetical protein